MKNSLICLIVCETKIFHCTLQHISTSIYNNISGNKSYIDIKMRHFGCIVHYYHNRIRSPKFITIQSNIFLIHVINLISLMSQSTFAKTCNVALASEQGNLCLITELRNSTSISSSNIDCIDLPDASNAFNKTNFDIDSN